MRRKCERGRGNINADGAGAEVFVGDGCSQGASFGPMVAISRRGQGGRIYNNTRTRERLRRKCVKPADLTTHSPPKVFAYPPRTATRPARALSLPHAARCIPRRPHNPFPAEGRHPPPHSDAPFPSTSDHPRNPDARPQAVRSIPRRPHHPFPVEALRSPPHSDTPFPNTSARPRSADAHPQAARCTPTALTTHSPPKAFARPCTATRPRRALPLPHAAPTHARRLRDAFPAEALRSPPQRHAASPSVPLRAQKNGTAQCMCDAECLGRPSLRSVIWVGEPRAVRRRCGALACRRGA